MTGGEDKDNRSWIDKIRARSGLLSGKQDTAPNTAPLGRSMRMGLGDSLGSAGARQAYERSIAKDKQRSKANQRANLLDMPLSELPVVIIDLETTGFEPQADAIISMGGWHITGTNWDEGEDHSFYEMVNPGMRIPSYIESLTGITNNVAGQARRLSDVLPELLAFMDNRLIIAHGIGHDKAFLRTALWRCQKRTWNYRMLDTMLLAKWLNPEAKPFDLDTLTAHYEIPIEIRHHALFDAKATGELWIRFLEQSLAKRITTLRDMYMYLSRY